MYTARRNNVSLTWSETFVSIRSLVIRYLCRCRSCCRLLPHGIRDCPRSYPRVPTITIPTRLSLPSSPTSPRASTLPRPACRALPHRACWLVRRGQIPKGIVRAVKGGAIRHGGNRRMLPNGTLDVLSLPAATTIGPMRYPPHAHSWTRATSNRVRIRLYSPRYIRSISSRCTT